MATWSAGQREFTPLMLGLYKLLPSAAIGKDPKITDPAMKHLPERRKNPACAKGFFDAAANYSIAGSVTIFAGEPEIIFS